MLENKIHQECCLDTLRKMPDDHVDVVVTSPPYNLNLRIRKGKYCSRQIVREISTKYTEFDDNLPLEDYYKFHSEVLRELLRVSHIIFYNIQIVTGSKRSTFKMIGEFADNLKDIVVWDKGYAQPAIQEKVLNRRSELILIFEKDYPISRQFRRQGKFERGTLDDVWQINRENSKSRSHAAVMPQELVRTILKNFSSENDLVYDPFMGTGTTAVVAQEMNRRFVGSEQSKKYIDIANTRLK
jgi:site-specific DNA-methyltransferase (adenine-specific)